MHSLPHERGQTMKDNEYQILTRDIDAVKQSLEDVSVPMATQLAIGTMLEDVYALYSGRGD